MSERPKLKPEIKAEWLRRLRSGQYEQGRNFLQNHNTFCCLGVLCDMAAEAGVGHWNNAPAHALFYAGLESRDQTLPRKVSTWATGGAPEGCSFHVPIEDVARAVPEMAEYLCNYTRQDTISLDYLNDNGFTFEQIARVIEACL